MCNDIKFCPDCKNDHTGYQWCFRCNPTRFEKEFSKWTSGNTFINKFIREAQIKAQKHDDVLEWIPFDRITNINHLDSEALFKAIWLDGPIETWDNDKQQWNRNTYEIDENLDGYEVVLKNLNNSSKSNDDEGFLNEWKHHFSCDYDKEHSLIRLFGFTQHPINLNHMIVMDYANEGSLKNFLPRIVKFNWHTRLNLLNDIIAGLEKIHDNNLVHCNLHDGNILTKRVRNNYNGLDLFQNFVDDLGSCQPFESVPSASSYNESIYGVLPFIAPEVLGGEPYTPASDIYSCSMIMWELTSGIPPFNGRTHDRRLMLSIYEGERPGIIQKTPRCYVELMKACWDPDPSERPTVTEISTIVQNWIYYTLKYYEEKRPLNIKHEIDRKLIKENIDQVVEEIDDEQSQNDTIEFWKADKGLAKEKVENHIHKQR